MILFYNFYWVFVYYPIERVILYQVFFIFIVCFRCVHLDKMTNFILQLDLIGLHCWHFQLVFKNRLVQSIRYLHLLSLSLHIKFKLIIQSNDIQSSILVDHAVLGAPRQPVQTQTVRNWKMRNINSLGINDNITFSPNDRIVINVSIVRRTRSACRWWLDGLHSHGNGLRNTWIRLWISTTTMLPVVGSMATRNGWLNWPSFDPFLLPILHKNRPSLSNIWMRWLL